MLTTLDLLFSDLVCTVDTANFNAARIWKVYGTRARKGDNTPERPHRRAKILTLPEQQELVPESELSRYGIGYSEKPYLDGTLFRLDTGPFSDAPQDGAYAVQFGNGAIFAGCHYTSCGGGDQRWSEFRRKFEKSEQGKERMGRKTRR